MREPQRNKGGGNSRRRFQASLAAVVAAKYWRVKLAKVTYRMTDVLEGVLANDRITLAEALGMDEEEEARVLAKYYLKYPHLHPDRRVDEDGEASTT